MKKAYSKKEFVVLLVISLGFTFFYFIVCYALWLDISAKLQVVIECLGIFLPLILVMSWYMCIERYISVVYDFTKNRNNKKYLVQVGGRIALLIICGICTFKSILEIVVFPLNSLREYMARFDTCYIIKMIIVMVWLAFLVFNISIRKIESSAKFGKLIVTIMLLGVILFLIGVANEYISGVWTQAWIQKMKLGN